MWFQYVDFHNGQFVTLQCFLSGVIPYIVAQYTFLEAGTRIGTDGLVQGGSN